MACVAQASEQGIHLARDVLRVAERALALEYAHSAEASRPGIDVLEEVAMDGAVVGDAQAALRQRLFGTLRRHGKFVAFERFGPAQARSVFQDRGVRIAVDFVSGIVHGRAALLAVFAG